MIYAASDTTRASGATSQGWGVALLVFKLHSPERA